MINILQIQKTFLRIMYIAGQKRVDSTDKTSATRYWMRQLECKIIEYEVNTNKSRDNSQSQRYFMNTNMLTWHISFIKYIEYSYRWMTGKTMACYKRCN